MRARTYVRVRMCSVKDVNKIIVVRFEISQVFQVSKLFMSTRVLRRTHSSVSLPCAFSIV